MAEKITDRLVVIASDRKLKQDFIKSCKNFGGVSNVGRHLMELWLRIGQEKRIRVMFNIDVAVKNPASPKVNQGVSIDDDESLWGSK